jgi:hypothetical protein
MEPPPSVRWRGTLLCTPRRWWRCFWGAGVVLLALVGVPGAQQAAAAAPGLGR